jgi:hypothetical protein
MFNLRYNSSFSLTKALYFERKIQNKKIKNMAVANCDATQEALRVL